MTRFDRRLLFTSGAAAALLAATGVAAATLPSRGGRLRVALSEASRQDTWSSDGLFMQAARATVRETLVELAPDGTLRGDIAARWGSSDGRVWSFDLQEDVRFHDGAGLTLADLAASLGALKPALEDLRLDGARLRLALTQPDANLPFLLADPRFAVRPAEEARAEAGIGTGLYRVRRFDAGRQFIATRVETHRKDGREGWFDEVEYVSIPAAEVRAEALRDGFVDVADVAALAPHCDASEYHCLPSVQQMEHAVHTSIALPAQMGTTWPLDNLAMARRWWKA